jgi:hypothetical protein
MAAKLRLMIGGAAVESLTDWVARHSFKHRPTIALALSRGDKMTPPAKFAAVTAAAMFGHQHTG